jgi:transcriptional regulator GlxA family with amidase domain
MSESESRITVALLATPEATASTLYGMYELFTAAGRDWAFIMTGRPGEARFRPVIVSTDGRRLRAANAIPIEPHYALADCPAPDIVCVPDLFVAPQEQLTGRYRAETEWLRSTYAAGALLATACSGALLLAESGLLDGQDVTTHWGYCASLAAAYPGLRVQANRALVVSGDGQRIVTAGGGTSWQDLVLFLVARFAGVEEAMRLARVYLIDWHDMGQQPYAALTGARQVEDSLIRRCQAWIAEHYDEPAPVAAMTRLSGLSDRSFSRRFSQVTGMPPMEYVHTLRLEEAKQMLEGGDLPVEAVANEVGYEDASFFGRLFRRKVGMTPARYRRRFGALRRTLQLGRTPSSQEAGQRAAPSPVTPQARVSSARR